MSERYETKQIPGIQLWSVWDNTLNQAAIKQVTPNKADADRKADEFNRINSMTLEDQKAEMTAKAIAMGYQVVESD